jgi:hypothetical protein
MSSLLKLRIKLPFQEVGEEICSLEEMENRFNWGNEPFLIAVEGKVISSYEKLKEFVQQDRFKDREFLDVEVRTFLVG